MKKSTRLISSLVLSVAFLGGTAFVWYQTVKPQDAFANLGDCNNNPDYKGCYTETWTASQVLGDVEGFDDGGNDSLIAIPGTDTNLCKNGIAPPPCIYRVPNSGSGSNGVILGNASNPTVIQWTVKGYVSQ